MMDYISVLHPFCSSNEWFLLRKSWSHHRRCYFQNLFDVQLGDIFSSLTNSIRIQRGFSDLESWIYRTGVWKLHTNHSMHLWMDIYQRYIWFGLILNSVWSNIVIWLLRNIHCILDLIKRSQRPTIVCTSQTTSGDRLAVLGTSLDRSTNRRVMWQTVLSTGLLSAGF